MKLEQLKEADAKVTFKKHGKDSYTINKGKDLAGSISKSIKGSYILKLYVAREGLNSGLTLPEAKAKAKEILSRLDVSAKHMGSSNINPSTGKRRRL